jgi:glycosyltransferase involved in cell wall biosynthesis
MNAPQISVIIPCFNLGHYLDEAVDSVLAQTRHADEILIVDDGSTDPATREMLADYRRPKTRVLHSENKGLPAAKNLGLASTSGAYVCMLDADDRLEPTMLEKSASVLDRDQSVAFVSHWLRTFGDETGEWTPDRCDFPALLDVNTVNGAALVRRDALVAAGGFDESMRQGCEDWDLWISVVERGMKGVILPEFLFLYRRRAGSMSRAMHENVGHPALYRRIVEKHQESYSRYLFELIIRRERDIAHLNRHNDDLEFEHVNWLGPELALRRDDVAMLQRKVEEDQRRIASGETDKLRRVLEDATLALAGAQARLTSSVAERDRLGIEIEGLKGDIEARAIAFQRAVANQQRALEAAELKARELDARAHRAEYALGDIRNSFSWRVTGPLRTVYAACRRALGMPA